MPPAPALLQVQVMAKHQGGAPLALAREDGRDVVGHHHVPQAQEPRHAMVGCFRHRGMVAKQPGSRARLHVRTPPVIARRGSNQSRGLRNQHGRKIVREEPQRVGFLGGADRLRGVEDRRRIRPSLIGASQRLDGARRWR